MNPNYAYLINKPMCKRLVTFLIVLCIGKYLNYENNVFIENYQQLQISRVTDDGRVLQVKCSTWDKQTEAFTLKAKF